MAEGETYPIRFKYIDQSAKSAIDQIGHNIQNLQGMTRVPVPVPVTPPSLKYAMGQMNTQNLTVGALAAVAMVRAVKPTSVKAGMQKVKLRKTKLTAFQKMEQRIYGIETFRTEQAVSKVRGAYETRTFPKRFNELFKGPRWPGGPAPSGMKPAAPRLPDTLVPVPPKPTTPTPFVPVPLSKPTTTPFVPSKYPLPTPFAPSKYPLPTPFTPTPFTPTPIPAPPSPVPPSPAQILLQDIIAIEKRFQKIAKPKIMSLERLRRLDELYELMGTQQNMTTSGGPVP